ncbi:MAG: sigma-70 region 4 domain-containing protein [Clostridia bacterium]|nr:sigma-70 region 4 domain-containing protein [Clostridia bacterium]
MKKSNDLMHIYDKMRDLRDKRDDELIANKKNDKVINVKYIGKIEIDGKEKNVYVLIEEKTIKEGEKVDVYRYYTEDGELIGGNNKGDQYDLITLIGKYNDKIYLVEQLTELEKEEIVDLKTLEEKKIEEIAKVLGIDKSKIDSICEIDIEKTLEELRKENSNDNNQKNENDDKSKYEKEKTKDEKGTIEKEKIEEVNNKTEIKTDQIVTDNKTIAQLLGVQDKGYKKIAVIYSDEMENNDNSTKFSFVGIKEDGSAEKIDSLEQVHGTNPSIEVNKINRDGSKIKEGKVQSSYKIKGTKESRISSRNWCIWANRCIFN